MNFEFKLNPGLNWALLAKLFSTFFTGMTGLLAVILLQPAELGSFLLLLILLSLFGVADAGAIGFLTVRSGTLRSGPPERLQGVFISGAACALLFAMFIGLLGQILLGAKGVQSVFRDPLWWWLIIGCHFAWQAVFPLTSFMDGLGSHSKAWGLICVSELVTGLTLAIPLLVRAPHLSLRITALAKLGMAVAILLVFLWDKSRPTLCQNSSSPWLQAWRKDIWPLQWTFFWLNLTGIACVRLIQPIIFHHHGPSDSGRVAIALMAAASVNNLSSAWASSALARLALSHQAGEMGVFHRIWRSSLLQSSIVCAVLLLTSAAGFEALRGAGPARLAAKLPAPSIYLPIFIGHLFITIGLMFGMGLRSTGRDTSAKLVGGFGLVTLPLYWWSASWSSLSIFSMTFLFLALVGMLLLWIYWRERWRLLRRPSTDAYEWSHPFER